MYSPELARLTNEADAARRRNRERILQQDPELAWSLGFGLPEPPEQAPWWRRLWQAIANRMPRRDGLTMPAALGRAGAEDRAPVLK
jgi:hypothetical protein